MARAHHAQHNAHPDLAVLRGGVAVITGGAAGIGFALAEAALTHGMHTVLADIDASTIASSEAQLRAGVAAKAGVEVFGHVTDVSSEESVNGLAAAVAGRFPGKPVSLLCLNAGTGGGGIVSSSHDVWQKTFSINVFGVAHCIRAFVPSMLKQEGPGAVVTTASQDGICASQGVYGASKHACVALTEGLFQELGGRLSVHCLCPHVTATNVFGGEALQGQGSKPAQAGARFIRNRFAEFGSPASSMATMVFEAIRTGKFYVFGENEKEPGFVRLQAETRMRAMLEGGLPVRPPSKIFKQVFAPPRRKAAPKPNAKL